MQVKKQAKELQLNMLAGSLNITGPGDPYQHAYRTSWAGDSKVR